ncbi:hypothetical protein NL676_013984 [Syzygium grande]|nr:hypothetical protein NL676_013984 [Syzygium grande]
MSREHSPSLCMSSPSFYPSAKPFVFCPRVYSTENRERFLNHARVVLSWIELNATAELKPKFEVELELPTMSRARYSNLRPTSKPQVEAGLDGIELKPRGGACPILGLKLEAIVEVVVIIVSFEFKRPWLP